MEEEYDLIFKYTFKSLTVISYLWVIYFRQEKTPYCSFKHIPTCMLVVIVKKRHGIGICIPVPSFPRLTVKSL